jgi:hypothetical protein
MEASRGLVNYLFGIPADKWPLEAGFVHYPVASCFVFSHQEGGPVAC